MGRVLSFPTPADGRQTDAEMTYEDFYEKYYDGIIRFLSRKCASWADAEDLASQCFVYCYEHWDSYKSDLASRKSWLFMVVQSRWKNYCRDHRTQVDLDDVIDVLPDEKDVIASTNELMAAREALAVALNQLPEAQKQAIIMKYFGQYGNDVIARKLGTSEGNVRILLHRGVKKLAVLLPEMGWEV